MPPGERDRDEEEAAFPYCANVIGTWQLEIDIESLSVVIWAILRGFKWNLSLAERFRRQFNDLDRLWCFTSPRPPAAAAVHEEDDDGVWWWRLLPTTTTPAAVV